MDGEETPAKKQQQSSLFLVTLRQEEAQAAEPQWAGRVVHITSGKARHYLNLSALGALLLEMAGVEDQRQDEGEKR